MDQWDGVCELPFSKVQPDRLRDDILAYLKYKHPTVPWVVISGRQTKDRRVVIGVAGTLFETRIYPLDLANNLKPIEEAAATFLSTT